jgi:hypothetical protein
MLTKSFGLDIHQQLIDLVRKLELSVDGETGPGSKEHYAKAVESLDRFPHLIDEVEPAKASLRGQEFFDEERYRESLFVIDRWLDVVSSLYFPTRMTVVDNQLSYSIYSSRDIIKAIHDETQNPYLDLYRRFFLPGFTQDTPDFVGVSITATSQIIPGLTLCRLIKEQFPQIHVTVGGSIFTRLVDNLRRCDRLFEITDDFIVFEGETALLEMINQLEGRKDFSKVPNLIWRQDGKITVNQPFYSENLAEHPAPNYKGFPLDQKVVDELEALSKMHDTPYFFFTDECLALSPTKRLCKELIKRGLDLQWTAELRFEKNLSRELLASMREAGCQKIVFGLETYNARLMDFMVKGITQENVARICSDCVDLGIAVHCYVIVGFPTETEEESLETMNFIVDNTKLNSSYGFSCQPCLFDLEKEAPIMSDPGAYGVQRIMRPASEDLSLGFFYEVKSGMTPDQAEKVYQYVYEKISEVVCELPFNYSMADGLLYIARHNKEREAQLSGV